MERLMFQLKFIHLVPGELGKFTVVARLELTLLLQRV